MRKYRDKRNGVVGLNCVSFEIRGSIDKQKIFILIEKSFDSWTKRYFFLDLQVFTRENEKAEREGSCYKK